MIMRNENSIAFDKIMQKVPRDRISRNFLRIRQVKKIEFDFYFGGRTNPPPPPHNLYLEQKGPFLYKSRTCGGLKKDPFFREICNAGETPPPPLREVVEPFIVLTPFLNLLLCMRIS